MSKQKELILYHLKELVNDSLAIEIVEKYSKVIELLNENHDSTRIQAEMYFHAHFNEVKPEEWIQHIEDTRNKYKK